MIVLACAQRRWNSGAPIASPTICASPLSCTGRPATRAPRPRRAILRGRTSRRRDRIVVRRIVVDVHRAVSCPRCRRASSRADSHRPAGSAACRATTWPPRNALDHRVDLLLARRAAQPLRLRPLRDARAGKPPAGEREPEVDAVEDRARVHPRVARLRPAVRRLMPEDRLRRGTRRSAPSAAWCRPAHRPRAAPTRRARTGSSPCCGTRRG